MHEVLLHLLPGAGAAKVIGRPGAISRLDGQLLHLGVGGVLGADVADIALHGGQKRLFELGPQMQQSRVPLPAGVDAGETAVMEFVADVEGELDVDAVGIGVVQDESIRCR